MTEAWGMCRAYKSAQASQFDLLFLYGFVSSHAAHGFFPLRVEWATPSAALAEQAAALFRRAVRPIPQATARHVPSAPRTG